MRQQLNSIEQLKGLGLSILKIRELFDSVAIPLCLVRDGGIIESVNERFTQDIGYTTEDIPTLNDWWQQAYPDEKYREWVIENWNNAVSQSAETGENIKSGIYQVTCKNGNQKKLIIAGSTMGTDFLATFIDVTDLQKAERTKDTLLHELNERIKEISCLHHVNTELTKNELDVFQTLTHIAEIIPSGWQYPKNTAVEISLDDQIIRTELYQESADFLYHPIVIDQVSRGYIKVSVFDLDDEPSKQPFLNEERELLKNISRDIENHISQLETKKLIQESERKYRTLYEASPVSLWEEDWTEVIHMVNELKRLDITDYRQYFENNIEWVNNALSKVIIEDVNQETLSMFNANNKEQMKASLAVVFATEDTIPGFIDELVALAEGQKLFETEMKLNTVDGKLIHTLLRMTFPSSHDNSGKVLVSLMDITAMKEMQKTLNQSMMELKRSNEDLEQFAYVASHDLREPLRMVSSYSRLLQQNFHHLLDEKAEKFLHFINEGTNRMNDLISNLLDYSRVTSRTRPFEKLSLNSLVSEVKRNLNVLIENSHATITEDSLPEIYVDSVQISSVFQNLISNGIKFSKKDIEPIIHISSEENDTHWIFSIQDNGIGVPEEHHEKIFIMFQRLHLRKEYDGNGMGLSIAKRIITRHKGSMWIKSKPGVGSTFYFSISKSLKDQKQIEN